MVLFVIISSGTFNHQAAGGFYVFCRRTLHLISKSAIVKLNKAPIAA